MRDCKSVRPGVLMHSKVIYVRPRDAASNPDHCFAYVGSANLSESAWYVSILSFITVRNPPGGIDFRIPPSYRTKLTTSEYDVGVEYQRIARQESRSSYAVIGTCPSPCHESDTLKRDASRNLHYYFLSEGHIANKSPNDGMTHRECGVLVPAEKKKEGSGDDAHSGNRQDMRVFEDCVPVPMEWPGQAICREDGNAANIDAKRPWFYSEG